MPAEPTGAKRLRDLTADFQDGVGQRLRAEIKKDWKRKGAEGRAAMEAKRGRWQ